MTDFDFEEDEVLEDEDEIEDEDADDGILCLRDSINKAFRRMAGDY